MPKAFEFEELNPKKTGSSVRGRLLKGTGAQLYSQGIQIFIRLAEVPLLLSFWGSQLYGEWLMLSAIPAYLAIGDGGFTGVACREMTMKNSSGDRLGAIVVFQSTWLLLIFISIVVVLMVYGFTEIVPLKKWLGFSTINAVNTQLVLLMLVIHVIVCFQGGLLQSGFWVSGKYPIGIIFSASTQLIEFLFFSLAVILGGGPVQAAAAYLGGRVLGTGLVWIGHNRVSSWLRYGLTNVSLSEIRRIMAPAFASLAFALGFCLNIQGTRLIVGLALGPSAVAVFTPLRTISRLAMQPRVIINQLVQPELASAFGAEDSLLFQRLFVRSCQFALWGSFIAIIAVGTCTNWVFPLWTNSMIVMQWPVYVILLAGVLANSAWYTALMVPYATNQHGRLAVYYCIIYGGFANGLGYLAATLLGLSGVALALLFSEAILAIIVIRESLQLSNMKAFKWVSAIIRPAFDIFIHFVFLVKRINSIKMSCCNRVK